MNTHRCTYCHKYFDPKKTSDGDNHVECIKLLKEAGLVDIGTDGKKTYENWLIQCRKYSNKSRPPKIVKVKKSALGES